MKKFLTGTEFRQLENPMPMKIIKISLTSWYSEIWVQVKKCKFHQYQMKSRLKSPLKMVATRFGEKGT